MSKNEVLNSEKGRNIWCKKEFEFISRNIARFNKDKGYNKQNYLIVFELKIKKDLEAVKNKSIRKEIKIKYLWIKEF